MFNQDSKLVRYGTKLGNLFILQILVIVTSIPVITLGPALTAMHSVLLEIYRDEETGIARSYFSAFAANFKQSLLIWLMYLAAFVFLIYDYLVLINAENMYLQMTARIIPLPLIALYITMLWVFPLQSRYENKIWNTIRNAFLMSVYKIVPTVVMLILSISPIGLSLVFPNIMIPVAVMLGFTLPGIANASLYSKVFDHLEGVDRNAPPEE